VVAVGGPPLATRADQVPVEAVFEAWCGVESQLQLALQRPRAV
jgi:hypothetical protein